ncbi:MAG: carboxypeptidase-like regulatory domain-containing protein [Leadbetterella sp.]|nr:carboxypeptidase-like regulatory domain-containing protein [Leadbetterella sp.]
MKIPFLLVIFSFFVLVPPARAFQKISGYVKDSTAAAIPYALVSLGKTTDSSMIKFEATDEQGYFEFEEVKEGKYYLKISSTGYRDFFSSPFEVTSPAGYSPGEIVLSAASTELGEVTVRAVRPVIELAPRPAGL